MRLKVLFHGRESLLHFLLFEKQLKILVLISKRRELSRLHYFFQHIVSFPKLSIVDSILVNFQRKPSSETPRV